MKLIITLAIFFYSFSFSFAQENCEEKISHKISEVKEKFAPDKRTALFNIKVKMENNFAVLSGESNLPEAKKELLNKLTLNQINFIDSVKILPSEELEGKIFAITNLSVSNLRSRPNHRGELVTQSLLGTLVKVLKKQDGFTLIQTPDHYLSWVDNAGIHLVDEKEMKNWKKTNKVFYLKEAGFSYELPDENSKRVSDLVAGNILTLISKDDNFFKVQYPDGRQAFVNSNESLLLDEWLSNINPSSESILHTAEKFMGVPYLWGGTSSKGMDCSGFTKTVHYLNGIVLPRDASQQVHVGELIDTDQSLNDLQPGDLLFFGRKKTADKKERITHVGIYKGNMEFIHASGRVKVNSFDSTAVNYNKHYVETLVRARRILNSVGTEGITYIKDHNFYNGAVK